MSDKLTKQPKILALCTVSTGLDSISEVLRSGYKIISIIGVSPLAERLDLISGWVDIAIFSKKWDVPYGYVNKYDLKDISDRKLFESFNFDLIWVVGWQRLIPIWLIESASLGALGGHGSPDGIHRGRGRSPQNWSIMLGCKQFNLALFFITTGIDDGPIILQRSFTYNYMDDISVSYKKSALAMGDMVCQVLKNKDLLNHSVKQSKKAFYYPQRKPKDGFVDWNMKQKEIWSHCRALTRPYPGLRTGHQSSIIIIVWECQPFDDIVDGEYGTISVCFESEEFLVNCADGRLLIKEWESCGSEWAPKQGIRFNSMPFYKQLQIIINRHKEKYPTLELDARIKKKAKV